MKNTIAVASLVLCLFPAPGFPEQLPSPGVALSQPAPVEPGPASGPGQPFPEEMVKDDVLMQAAGQRGGTEALSLLATVSQKAELVLSRIKLWDEADRVPKIGTTRLP